MYLNYYSLKEPPFSTSPDPKFLWFSTKHEQAFSALKYGILEEKGFLTLIGEVGTGKTLLIKNLINEIGIPAIIVTIPDPDMNILDFFNFLAEEIEMKRKFRVKGEFLIHFKQFLLEAYGADKRVLLIVDEAQRLNLKLLEQIRLLSNIEMTDRKLINIFFVGQTEFDEMLMNEKSKATRQRIAVRCRLEPLDEEETAIYINHRLKVVGADREIFNADAMQEIYYLSGGFPRIINIICDNALAAGYSAKLDTINRNVILENKENLYIPEDNKPGKRKKPKLIQSNQKKRDETDQPDDIDQEDEISQVQVSETSQADEIAQQDENSQPNEIFDSIMLKNESSRKPSNYIRNSIIFVILFIFGFAGYYIYDSNNATHTPWSVQDIAPKKDFRLSEVVSENIRSKSDSSIETQHNDRMSDLSTQKTDDGENASKNERQIEPINQDKAVDNKLITQTVPEVMKTAQSGAKKESEIKPFDQKNIPEDQMKTRMNYQMADLQSKQTKIEENITEKETQIEPLGQDEAVEYKTIAQIVPEEMNIVESEKKKESEIKLLDLKNIPNYQFIVQNSPIAKVENDRDLSQLKGTEEASENAPLYEDQSVLNGEIYIHFDYNSLKLSEQSHETLKIILGIISNDPSLNIIIEGYTDSKGNYVYNQKLSQFRANVVKAYFTGKGISPTRIEARGMGAKNPIGNNETAAGRTLNRRVEIQFRKEM